MLNFLINCLIVLAIIVTIYLIGITFFLGGVAVAAIVGKVIEIMKDDKKS